MGPTRPSSAGGGEALGGPTWFLLVLFGGALVAYSALAIAFVRGDGLARLDRRLAVRIAGEMPTWAEWIARPFTWIGGLIGVVICVLGAVVLLIRVRRLADTALVLVVAIGIEVLVVTGKRGYERPRPDVGSAIDLPSTYSFPSRHAAVGIAVFGLLGLIVARRIGSPRAAVGVVLAGFGLGVAAGCSRLVLNVHYLGDVLAGWCLGLGWLTACLLIFRALQRIHPMAAPSSGP